MLDDFVYVCDDAYSRKQLMDKEREVLKIVGFDVGYPLSYRFVRRYGRVSLKFDIKNVLANFFLNSNFHNMYVIKIVFRFVIQI